MQKAEPSRPCEPWPSCYPHPCHPWPACSTTLSGGVCCVCVCVCARASALLMCVCAPARVVCVCVCVCACGCTPGLARQVRRQVYLQAPVCLLSSNLRIFPGCPAPPCLDAPLSAFISWKRAPVVFACGFPLMFLFRVAGEFPAIATAQPVSNVQGAGSFQYRPVAVESS